MNPREYTQSNGDGYKRSDYKPALPMRQSQCWAHSSMSLRTMVFWVYTAAYVNIQHLIESTVPDF